MKASQFVVALSSAVLLASGLVQAEPANDTNTYHNQFVAKRPYAQPLAESANQTDRQWEGATLIQNADAGRENALSRQTTQRVNALSKRPF